MYMYRGWPLKLEITPRVQCPAKCTSVYREDKLRCVFVHGAFPFKIYQRSYQGHARNWRKDHVGDSESSAKDFIHAALLSGKYS